MIKSYHRIKQYHPLYNVAHYLMDLYHEEQDFLVYFNVDESLGE